MRRWWSQKLRQTRAYLHARVSSAQLATLRSTLTPAQFGLFERMHVADQRHGIAVMDDLRRAGANRELQLAGLFHDAGKGRSVRLAHRVAWSLGEAYGPWVWRLAALVPTFAPALDRLRHHAELSAGLAVEAGCSARTVELIRLQDRPADDEGRLLHAADEAH